MKAKAREDKTIYVSHGNVIDDYGIPSRSETALRFLFSTIQ
jgi:hypothetical protein